LADIEISSRQAQVFESRKAGHMAIQELQKEMSSTYSLLSSPSLRLSPSLSLSLFHSSQTSRSRAGRRKCLRA
ncbi:unnamed protein product, partial [Closterium sp. NIES-53]